MQGTVLVTGASGYVGAHVVDQLLRMDHAVVAVVRTPSQQTWLQSRYPENPNLGFVQVPDLTEDHSLDYVFKLNPGIRHVIHTACPSLVSGAQPDRARHLFDPAVRMNRNLVRAAAQYGVDLHSVVFGSCFGAMVAQPPRLNDPTMTYDGRHHNPISRDDALRADLVQAFMAARAFGEDAAWDAYQDEQYPPFSLMAILMPMVLGPPIHDVNLARAQVRQPTGADEALYGHRESYQLLYRMLHGHRAKPFQVPFCIDVRDAAEALIRAAELAPAECGRLFIASSHISPNVLLDAAHQTVPELAFRLPRAMPGLAEDEQRSQCQFDVSQAEARLRLRFRSLEATVADTVKALVELERLNA